MRIIYRPITTDSHLLADEPISRLLQRGVFRRNAGFRQRDDVDRGVPNGGKTGLYAKIIGIVDKQSCEIFFRLRVNGISFRIAKSAQRDQTVQYRWKHRCETVATFANPLDHPPFGSLKRASAKRPDPQRMQEFQNIFDSQKEIAPGPEAFTAGQPQVSLLGAEWIELVQLLFAGQDAGRSEMVDDGKRYKHGPAPRRHFVHVKWPPAWQEYHFNGDCWQIFPWKLTEERQIKLAEGVHLRNTATAHDVGARFLHKRRICRTAGKF